jgi:mannose-6-phosphate isomerase-like protein (cupin superfamily)
MPTQRNDPARALGIEVVRASGPARSRHDIEATLHGAGLTPHAWGNAAGFSYARHVHEHHKVLFCVSGSIVFHTDEGDVVLGPGDRMELPSGVGHGATVGDDGVECVEAYRS